MTIKEAKLNVKMIDAVALAAEMCTTPKTLRRWAERGEFPRPRVVQIRKTLWAVEDVNAFLATNKPNKGGER